MIEQILIAFIVALITSGAAYFLLPSQRKQNVASADSDIATAAAALNVQTIALMAHQKAEQLEMVRRVDALDKQIAVLEAQAIQHKREVFLYKQYINYLLNGIRHLVGQLEDVNEPPGFIPYDLEEFELNMATERKQSG